MLKKIFKILLILGFVIFPLGFLVRINITENIKLIPLDLVVFLMVVIGLLAKFKKKPVFAYSIYTFLGLSVLVFLLRTYLVKAYFPYVLTDLAYLVRIISYFLLVVILPHAVTLRDKRLIKKGLLISGFTVVVTGIVQYLLYPDLRNLLYLGWDPHFHRLFATFFDPNFAGIILVLIFFRIYYSFGSGKFSNKLLYVLLLFTCLTAIYLTRSRSAYLAFLSGLSIALIYSKNYAKKLLFIFVVIFLIFQLLPKPRLDVLDILRIPTSSARINNWSVSLNLSLDSPLIGLGYSKFRFSDASLLYVFGSSGIFVLIAYLWLWKKIIADLSGNNELVVSLIVVVVSSVFNNTLFYSFIMYWLAMLVCLSYPDQGS